MRASSIRLLIAALFAVFLTPVSVTAAASQDGSTAAFAPGRVLVRFKEGARSADRDRARRHSRARYASSIAGPRLEVLSVERGHEGASVESLRRDPSVASADLDWVRRAFSHAPGEVPWGVQAVQAPQVWGTVTGAGVVVAVVDSGVDLSHPDLAGAIAQNVGETGIDGGGNDRRTNGVDDDANGLIDDWRGWDFAAGDASPLDIVGHGTGVAGVVAAAHDGVGIAGVAPGAKILPVRVLDDEGAGTDEDIIAGIVYAAERGAKIINMSLGAPFYSDAVRSAVDYATAQGALVVAASGNGPAPAHVVPYPAGFDNVLSVGATNSSGQPAPFSLTGKVDIAAPGQDVVVSRMGGGTETVDGTSFAAPHVAGVAALVAQLHPSATGRRIRQIVAANATDVTSPGNDIRTGAGIVNAQTAVQNTGNLMSVAAAPRVVAGNGETTAPLTVTVSGPDGLPLGAEQHLTFAGTSATPSASEATTSGNGTATLDVSSTAAPGSTGTIEVTWLEGARTIPIAFTITGADDDMPGVPVQTPVTARPDSLGPGVDRDVVAISACPGERVKVELRSSDTAHILTVAAYEGGSVFDTNPVAVTAGPDFPAVLVFDMPAAGTAYVATEAWDMGTFGPPLRSVGYSLTIKREPRATASLTRTHISPNADGAYDTTSVTFRPLVTGPMLFKVLDRNGNVIETRDFGTVAAGTSRTEMWNGKRPDGSRLPDGYYSLKLLWNGPCPWQWAASVAVDTAKPLLWGVNDTDPFFPITDGYKDATKIWFELNEGAEVLLKIHPWGTGRVVRTLRAWKPRGISFIEWNGRDDAGRLLPAGGYEYQFWLTDYARNTHLPATGKYTVNLSHKRLVGKRVTLQRRANEAFGGGPFDEPECGNPRAYFSRRYAGGVLLTTGDCNGVPEDEVATLAYRFTAPAAHVYYSMQVVVEGGSSQGDAGKLGGLIKNWSSGGFDPAGGAGYVLGNGFIWHGYGWSPAAKHVAANRNIEVVLGLLDCCRDTYDDFDLGTVQLHLSYAVLQ